MLPPKNYLGIDCGAVSLKLALHNSASRPPVTVYLRTHGRPLETFGRAITQLLGMSGDDLVVEAATVTGSARDLLCDRLGVPAINEIIAHAQGAVQVNPDVRTVIEIGGQDSKFIKIEPSRSGEPPRVSHFRMNESCAAGTGAFLDEQAGRLGIQVDSFGSIALKSRNPISIAGRCAVFAKTDMVHKAQEGAELPDILMGVAYALVRNYVATLVRGESLEPLVSLQGGVMSNEALVRAFKRLLNIDEAKIVRPPHYMQLGALGCAVLASQSTSTLRLHLSELGIPPGKSPLKSASRVYRKPVNATEEAQSSRSLQTLSVKDATPPFVLGLDIGSVSVKGALLDGTGRIIFEDYRLSLGRPLKALAEFMQLLASSTQGFHFLAVTGSGRRLVGGLLKADLVLNEISAQARAAQNCDSSVRTIVDIGGQDSKWILIDQGNVEDFRMNRLCSAGTGSFLMEQASRLGLSLEHEFSNAGLSSKCPAHLESRCAVFLESDLIHHQNRGVGVNDLAAGVCESVARNYLETVANFRSIREKVMFVGGVACTDAVRVAFERQTGVPFEVPPFFRVSGAFGAALKCLDIHRPETYDGQVPRQVVFNSEQIPRSAFRCGRCPNNCRIEKYHMEERSVFAGGICDRWEDRSSLTRKESPGDDFFGLRERLIGELNREDSAGSISWGTIRSPQFWEWGPFWHGLLAELGVSLVLPEPTHREQFESGLPLLRVETCLPIKSMSGQLLELVNNGIRTVFHPNVLTEEIAEKGRPPRMYCEYTQASSLFLKGSLDVNWVEPTISYELDPRSLVNECISFARKLGFSKSKAISALNAGRNSLARFQKRLNEQSLKILNSLDPSEPALIVFGKPYHTGDAFLNMNLGLLTRRLGVAAIPSDLLPVAECSAPPEVSRTHQARMIHLAREIARVPNCYPVFLTFFGCIPDPFVVNYLKEAFKEKPLLTIEMDEHTSGAGLMTRLEAFLDCIHGHGRTALSKRPPAGAQKAFVRGQDNIESGLIRRWDSGASTAKMPDTSSNPLCSKRKKPSVAPQVLCFPQMSDSSYGLASGFGAVGIDVQVLPPPDQESQDMGRSNLVGGECLAYTLILGDFIKLTNNVSGELSDRYLFFIPGEKDVCRLWQFPTYLERVRKELGLSLRIVGGIERAVEVFGKSPKMTQRVLLRGWEGLVAYDVLIRAVGQIRPFVKDRALLQSVYETCRDNLFRSLCHGRVRQGIEEALHQLWEVPCDRTDDRPIVAVTGDYYTRVVPYANNHVYQEIEAMGATLLTPPTLSDAFKMWTLRDTIWGMMNRNYRSLASNVLIYGVLALSEFRVKGHPSARKVFRRPSDYSGARMWRFASSLSDTRLPGGITGPIASALEEIEAGANGLLNLTALNCSYGTVITAALSGVQRSWKRLPMLTLVYDGLNKTNEKTRIEAFMHQVWDTYKSR